MTQPWQKIDMRDTQGVIMRFDDNANLVGMYRPSVYFNEITKAAEEECLKAGKKFRKAIWRSMR